MGKILFLQKKYSLAVVQFQKALVYNPTSAATLCYLATILNLEGRYQETITLLDLFDFKNHNNLDGETMLSNKVVALLHTNCNVGFIQALVSRALSIRPSSLFIKNLLTQLETLHKHIKDAD